MGVTAASIELDGSRISYLTAGSGDRAVVCVHGLGQSSVIWKRVVEALPPGWQGYALDLLGFGDSSKPESGYSLGMHARTVGAFLDAIPQQRVVLAANSLGGVVALSVARDRQSEPAGLVLAATGARVRDPDGLRRYRERLAAMEMTHAACLDIARKWCFRTQNDEVLNELALAVGKARREAMLETMSSSLATDLRPDLATIALPTLVVQGMEDAGRTPEDGLEIARGVQDGRLLVLPRVGHTPMLDAPEEFQRWLTSAITSWL